MVDVLHDESEESNEDEDREEEEKLPNPKPRQNDLSEEDGTDSEHDPNSTVDLFPKTTALENATRQLGKTI